MAICFDDRVNIYKFNGLIYNKIQTILLSTNCRAIGTNDDFSILIITGTNLFQVYTYSVNKNEYINFYIFPSQLGITYNNFKVSSTSDGMKIVIVSSIVSNTITYNGHYYFIYNKTIN